MMYKLIHGREMGRVKQNLVKPVSTVETYREASIALLMTLRSEMLNNLSSY